MSSLTSLSYDDDEQMKEETLSRPSQACCFPFTRVANLPESRKYEVRGLRIYLFDLFLHCTHITLECNPDCSHLCLKMLESACT